MKKLLIMTALAATLAGSGCCRLQCSRPGWFARHRAQGAECCDPCGSGGMSGPTFYGDQFVSPAPLMPVPSTTYVP